MGSETPYHTHIYLITVAHIAISDNITFISLVIWVQMGLWTLSSNVGAVPWRRTGILTFDGNRSVKKAN